MVDEAGARKESLSKPRHIRELDGIRGIAALAVFVHHLAYTSIHPANWNSLAILSLYNAGRYGLYGVDLFFVLSGYLITSILLKDRCSTAYWHNFYWKRALRILPLYFLSLLGVWIWIPGTTGGVIVSAFFLANFCHLFHVDIGGPYWTLAIEEQFYLIWPQFVRRLDVARLKKLALAIVIAEPLMRLVAAAFHHFDFVYTFFRCDGLALGAFLACQFQEKQIGKADLKRSGLQRHSPWWLLLLAMVSLMATAKMMQSSRVTLEGNALFLSAANFFFYVLIRIAVQASGSRYLAVFRSAILVFFGEISYCMYMSHTYVERLYHHWAGPLPPGNIGAYWIRIATVLAVTILICIVSRYAVELPFISLRKYVLKKPVPMDPARRAALRVPTETCS